MIKRLLLTIFFPISLLTAGCISTTTDDIAKPDQKKFVQNTLEKNISGQSNDLLLSPTVRISITPVETWKSITGHFCRSFITEIWSDKTLQTKELSTACRNDNGNWISVSI